MSNTLNLNANLEPEKILQIQDSFKTKKKKKGCGGWGDGAWSRSNNSWEEIFHFKSWKVCLSLPPACNAAKPVSPAACVATDRSPNMGACGRGRLVLMAKQVSKMTMRGCFPPGRLCFSTTMCLERRCSFHFFPPALADQLQWWACAPQSNYSEVLTPVPVNVALCENRVFAGVTKSRWDLSGEGGAWCTLWGPTNASGTGGQMHRKKPQSRDSKYVAAGQECQGWLAPTWHGRGEEAPTVWISAGPASTLTVDFEPLELGENRFLLSAARCVVFVTAATRSLYTCNPQSKDAQSSPRACSSSLFPSGCEPQASHPLDEESFPGVPPSAVSQHPGLTLKDHSFLHAPNMQSHLIDSYTSRILILPHLLFPFLLLWTKYVQLTVLYVSTIFLKCTIYYTAIYWAPAVYQKPTSFLEQHSI